MIFKIKDIIKGKNNSNVLVKDITSETYQKYFDQEQLINLHDNLKLQCYFHPFLNQGASQEMTILVQVTKDAKQIYFGTVKVIGFKKDELVESKSLSDKKRFALKLEKEEKLLIAQEKNAQDFLNNYPKWINSQNRTRLFRLLAINVRKWQYVTNSLNFFLSYKEKRFFLIANASFENPILKIRKMKILNQIEKLKLESDFFDKDGNLNPKTSFPTQYLLSPEKISYFFRGAYDGNSENFKKSKQILEKYQQLILKLNKLESKLTANIFSKPITFAIENKSNFEILLADSAKKLDLVNFNFLSPKEKLSYFRLINKNSQINENLIFNFFNNVTYDPKSNFFKFTLKVRQVVISNNHNKLVLCLINDGYQIPPFLISASQILN